VRPDQGGIVKPPHSSDGLWVMISTIFSILAPLQENKNNNENMR